MAYRIKISETPQQALRRIGLAQADRALVAISAANGSGNPVHETRKCLKRIRALLRLVRPGLDETVFETENARFRDIARVLAPARDKDILSETLAKLAAHANPEQGPALDALKADLERVQVEVRSDEAAAAIDQARTQLTSAKAVIGKLKLNGRGFEPVERGLRKSYQRGHRLFELAYQGGTNDTLHDFRKSVQLHWRHMALVSTAWPEMFSIRVEAARQLSQILGECQDLTVLLHHIESLPPDALVPPQELEITAFIQARQQHLKAIAQPRAAQLFSLTPKTLSRCVTETWRAAQHTEDLAVKSLGVPPDEPHPLPRVKNAGATVTALRTTAAVKRSRSEV